MRCRSTRCSRDTLRGGLERSGARIEYSVSIVDGSLQVSARLIGAADIEEIEALVTGLEAGLEAGRTAAASSPPAADDVVRDTVSQALSHTRLTREGGGFTLDVDVPAALVRNVLAQCTDSPPELTEHSGDDEAPAEDDVTPEDESFE